MSSKENLPRHVAIIMDGNGRWAEKQGFPRIKGHEQGGRRVDEIVEEAVDLGIEYLTLYAFSKENWSRPKDEVDFLINLLLSNYLDEKLTKLKKSGIRFNVIGRRGDLPAGIQKKIDRNMQETRSLKQLVLTLALSYSSREEITEACRRIATKVQEGKLTPDAITEAAFQNELYTSDLPDPDLLIRTSGELRISNFLLWQISYTEIYVTDKFWPEFTKEEFRKAIEAYQGRSRRFGLTESQIQK